MLYVEQEIVYIASLSQGTEMLLKPPCLTWSRVPRFPE